jgi:hypothetical protein
MKRVLLCAALLAWSGMASAVVYKWVDAQGKIQYGDTPPDGVHAEIVELLGVHNSRSAASAPAPAPAASTARTVPGTPTPGENSQAKQAVDQDVTAERAKQCADAQVEYKKLIEGRRLYRTGDNGEKQFLTSEEIDTARINAKQEVDTLCGSGAS